MSTPAQLAESLHHQLLGKVDALPGSDLEWVRARRLQAANELLARGFPTRKDEAWRYTDLNRLFAAELTPATDEIPDQLPKILASLALDDPETLCLVFVNGHFKPDLSDLGLLPPEVTLNSVSQAQKSHPELLKSLYAESEGDMDAFASLNTAYSADGLFLLIPQGCALERPLDLVYLSAAQTETSTANHPASWVVLESAAQARISERFVSMDAQPCLTNARTHIRLGPGSELIHFRSQVENLASHHVGNVEVRLAKEASYQAHCLALGGCMGRTQFKVRHQGPRAACTINGLYLAHDKQVQDFHTDVEHLEPGCTTREHFKGVLTGKGKGVFDGRILVARGAQQTDANMSNNNLLLSRDAEVDTKPQLIIHADDVKCSHGATVGQLDPEALFYLRSRGLPETQARHLLTRGFATDVLERIPAGVVRDWMEQQLEQTLQTRLENPHV